MEISLSIYYRLIDDAESMVIDNGEWNMQSIARYDQWKMENADEESEQPKMYQLIVSYCNATKYKEWASHTFGLKEDELPMMLIFSPIQDGYWKYNAKEQKMIDFVDDVFGGKLEITYTRSWIARQAIKLEKWLNSLNAWQLPLLFIGIFGFLCGVMVLLDQCCAPTEQLKTD